MVVPVQLPRGVMPGVLASFARALIPGGQVLLGMHLGDGDVERTDVYGGVPVTWTTHLWQPDQLAALLAGAGLEPVADMRLPADRFGRAKVVLVARRRC